MIAVQFYTPLASFLADHGDEVKAVVTVVIAIVVAKLVDRALVKRGRKLSQAVGVGDLSPVAVTRLRLIRRLVSAAIIVPGIARALLSLPHIQRVAAGLLASSAVFGLVVGFAARQTLANAIAGVLLAISQPIRIGDLVTFEGETGEVEDVRLTYTYIRLDDGRRLVVPNERLAETPVQNHTVVDPRVQVEVSAWLAPGADVDRALELIEEDEGVAATVAESDKEGIRLSATTWAARPGERGAGGAPPRAGLLRR